MTFLRSLLLVCPAACLLAQTPTPKPAAPAVSSPKQAAPDASTPQQGTPQRIPVKIVQDPPPVPAVVPPDRVVLTLGDLKITAADFDKVIDGLPDQVKIAARGPARKQFADNLIRVLVLADEAKRRKLDATPIYKFQASNLLAGLAYKDITGEVKVSDADLHKYYDAHATEWDEVNARHILIRVQGSPMPVKAGAKDLPEAEALAKAQELRKKIVAGADFAKLAETESDDTGSAANGGSLGSFKHGQMVPSFDQAAFAMKAGEISEPVKSQYGYHIIKVESRQSKTFEQAKDEIEKKLQPEQAQKVLEEMVKKAAPVYDPEFFSLAKQ